MDTPSMVRGEAEQFSEWCPPTARERMLSLRAAVRSLPRRGSKLASEELIADRRAEYRRELQEQGLDSDFE